MIEATWYPPNTTSSLPQHGKTYIRYVENNFYWRGKMTTATVLLEVVSPAIFSQLSDVLLLLLLLYFMIVTHPIPPHPTLQVGQDLLPHHCHVSRMYYWRKALQLLFLFLLLTFIYSLFFPPFFVHRVWLFPIRKLCTFSTRKKTHSALIPIHSAFNSYKKMFT